MTPSFFQPQTEGNYVDSDSLSQNDGGFGNAALLEAAASPRCNYGDSDSLSQNDVLILLAHLLLAT